LSDEVFNKKVSRVYCCDTVNKRYNFDG